MQRRLSFVVAALILTSSAPAAASLDMAELYLRKVRQGERTYFQNGGWTRWRNRLDLFYEADYILGAGTGDPRFVTPDSEGDPLGAYSLGAIALLSHPRSAYQLSFFSMVSRTFEVDTENDVFTILPLLAPLVPGAFAKERGVSLTQGVTGFQVRFEPYVELSYGLLFDERRGQRVYRSFIEANVPFLFLKSNVVPAPEDDRIERVQTSLSYDQLTWASNIEAGFLRTNVNDKRTFVYAGFDDLFGYVRGNVRATTDAELAYAQLGLHFSTYEYGDVRRNGKFGTAWDLVLEATVTNPRHANYWSDAFGRDELQPGFKAEAYVQMPMMSWLGAAMILLTASAAALEPDEAKRQKTIDDGVKASVDAFDAADEDDSLYGGLTFGVDLNDPGTLREVPGAIDKLHIYFRFRVLY